MSLSRNQPFVSHSGDNNSTEPSCEYEVTNSVGVVLYTSSDLDLARQEARRKAVTFPGVRVIRVRRLEERQVVFTPRPTIVRTQ